MPCCRATISASFTSATTAACRSAAPTSGATSPPAPISPAACHQAQVYGLTVPLITKADGTKFGKTEAGAIWLDPKKTSPYAFYQFWLNTADADVYKFLKFFTFLPLARIEEIEAADRSSGGKPEAQRILADEATRLVHGESALLAARRITDSRASL